MAESALTLINEANDYLDSIDESGNSYDKSRLNKLEEYKRAMLLLGFNAPFSALMAAAKEELGDSGADELSDQRKQMKQIRYIASLKKFTLNRVRVAVASHKLAGAMLDFGRPEHIKFLPFSGSYLKMIVAGGEHASEAYRKLISLFEQRRFSIKAASAVLEVEQEGMPQERVVQLSSKADPMKAVEGMFGASVKIKDVKIARKSSGLIKNHSTKVALFTMAALAAAKQAKAIMLSEEAEDKKLAQYNSILRAHGLFADVTITESDRFEHVKEKLFDAKLLTKVKGEWLMDEEFEKLLYKRRNQHKHLVAEKADALVYDLLIWYYVCFSSDARKSYGSLPSILSDPTEKQLAILADLAPARAAIKHSPKIIAQKLDAEANAPAMPSKVWGPAFICARTKAQTGWASMQFNIEKSEIERAMPLVQSLMQKPQGRGAQFLKGLKKK